MTKNITDIIDEPEIFRHNGMMLLLYADKSSISSTTAATTYSVRDGAGRILGDGNLPLEFYHDNALLMFDMGPGKDLSPEGKVVEVQRPLLYFLANTKGNKILLQ